MLRRYLRIALIALCVAATSACRAGASSPAPASPTPRPAATSFEEYAGSFCAAFDAMFQAVGNPDTAGWSDLHKALDSAVAVQDAETAERLAAEITSGLDAGRQHVAHAGSWPPAAEAMAQLDRVFVAFEAYIAAKAAAAAGDADAIDPQTAFEKAGGVEAWFGMRDFYSTIAAERPATVQPCPNVPVSP